MKLLMKLKLKLKSPKERCNYYIEAMQQIFYNQQLNISEKEEIINKIYDYAIKELSNYGNYQLRVIFANYDIIQELKNQCNSNLCNFKSSKKLEIIEPSKSKQYVLKKKVR